MTERFEINGITVLIGAIEKTEKSRRENEQRAVRVLIDAAFGKEAELGHDENGAPYIAGSGVSISISHSQDYAALAYSAEATVGIDIEQPRTQLRHVAPRVLSTEEQAVYGQTDRLLLRAWTLKEALYKAALTPGLDFRSQICLPTDLDSRTAIVNGEKFIINAVNQPEKYTIAIVSR